MAGNDNKDEEFLRDYLVNRRWRAAEKRPPFGGGAGRRVVEASADDMADVLLQATSQRAVGSDEPLLTRAEDLEADDDFLIKARRFEDAWNNNDADLVSEPT